MKEKRKILVCLVDRANYGRMRLVMKAIQEHPELELQVMCSGTMVLERFGSTTRLVEEDGFAIDSRVFMELEGSVPLSMAKSLGFGVIEFASEIGRLRPDIMLLIGDRYEALAAVLAAAYTNVPIAHVQGGEVSGSIDESARHAITKFAHWHFPSTARAADYICRMGEPPDRVFNFGCPVGDYILQLEDTLPPDAFEKGSGATIDPNQPFNLVIFHPTTTAFGGERQQVKELLTALDQVAEPTLFLWPNIDAGSDHISKELRMFREQVSPTWLRFITNLTPVMFQRALKCCTVAIGNSSSFVRDSTFTGTPIVLVGDRQRGREVGNNTIRVPVEGNAILHAIQQQMKAGRYPPDTLYGDGNTSPKIAATLADVDIFIQKTLAYVDADMGEALS